jgi:protoheme IX farnesyltransferase
MLPVVAGFEETRRQIVIYSALLVPIALLPVLTGLGGVAYGVAAAGLGAIFMALALSIWRTTEQPAADRAAKRLFAFSIFYLFGLFAVLLAEHTVRIFTA